MRKIIYSLALFVFLFTGIAYSQSMSLSEMDDMSRRLSEKEKELNAKEQQLNARQEKLDALEKDLILRESNLSAIRKEITNKLEKLNTGADAELDRLAKLFASTKAKEAASIIIKMDLDKSAALMGRISAMTAGKIMAEIAKQNPDYASRLTLRMAGDTDIKTLNEGAK